MKFFITAILLLCSAAPALAQTSSPTTRPSPFVVYDNLAGYTGKPDTAALGWRRIITRHDLLAADGTQPDEPKCRQLGKDAAAQGALAVINIEPHEWPARGSGVWRYPVDIRNHSVHEVADTLRKLRQATAWVRAGAGDTKILVSHYGLPVIRDYWTPVNGNPGELARWRLANDKLAELAADLDVICPSLYGFYEGDGGEGGNWQRFALANGAEAKRVGGGKPVVPFAWWRWHDSNPRLGRQYKDSADWRVELRTIKATYAGVVAWDWAPGQAWPQAGWRLWTVTVEELSLPAGEAR